jgi:hypothetical protein
MPGSLLSEKPGRLTSHDSFPVLRNSNLASLAPAVSLVILRNCTRIVGWLVLGLLNPQVAASNPAIINNVFMAKAYLVSISCCQITVKHL